VVGSTVCFISVGVAETMSADAKNAGTNAGTKSVMTSAETGSEKATAEAESAASKDRPSIGARAVWAVPAARDPQRLQPY
jgi:hypothetical protein